MSQRRGRQPYKGNFQVRVAGQQYSNSRNYDDDPRRITLLGKHPAQSPMDDMMYQSKARRMRDRYSLDEAAQSTSYGGRTLLGAAPYAQIAGKPRTSWSATQDYWDGQERPTRAGQSSGRHRLSDPGYVSSQRMSQEMRQITQAPRRASLLGQRTTSGSSREANFRNSRAPGILGAGQRRPPVGKQSYAPFTAQHMMATDIYKQGSLGTAQPAINSEKNFCKTCRNWFHGQFMLHKNTTRHKAAMTRKPPVSTIKKPPVKTAATTAVKPTAAANKNGKQAVIKGKMPATKTTPKVTKPINKGTPASTKPPPKESPEDDDEDIVIPEYSLDKVYARDYVIPVSGFFCRLCHKFYNFENTAYDVHCRTKAHFDKYVAMLEERMRKKAEEKQLLESGVDIEIAEEEDVPQQEDESASQPDETLSPELKADSPEMRTPMKEREEIAAGVPLSPPMPPPKPYVTPVGRKVKRLA